MTNNNSTFLMPLYPILYDDIVRRALLEDVGHGDLTTDSIVSPMETTVAAMTARAPGRIAGIEAALHAFYCLDAAIETELLLRDGTDVETGQTIAVIRGPARPILSAERTALNLLARLSGIATATRDIAASVAQYKARVVCTRKTTPGLRLLEKYAVRAGGGDNHRFGLDDAVLVKDNHIAIAGGVSEAVRRARRRVGHMVKIEVEVDTLQQLEVVLNEKVDAVLLDNMPPETLLEAVRMVDGRIITEASGGITPETAAAVAATGVDLLSIGWITQRAPAMDLALDIYCQRDLPQITAGKRRKPSS
ncbi:MAG TPA: carboxylating nicotinate-nucleotide diphosphorylase [Acidobacteriota bacterium]|nr:carboxylating nicotinate-nucleotide diphosphorylase [Acidobacteriota bacterium]